MEYCDGSSLEDYLRSPEALDASPNLNPNLNPLLAAANPERTGRVLEEGVIAAVTKQILQGLQYLHAQNKIHRDIKACNILLTSRGNAKIADFGIRCALRSSNSIIILLIYSISTSSILVLRRRAIRCVAPLSAHLTGCHPSSWQERATIARYFPLIGVELSSLMT